MSLKHGRDQEEFEARNKSFVQFNGKLGETLFLDRHIVPNTCNALLTAGLDRHAGVEFVDIYKVLKIQCAAICMLVHMECGDEARSLDKLQISDMRLLRDDIKQIQHESLSSNITFPCSLQAVDAMLDNAVYASTYTRTIIRSATASNCSLFNAYRGMLFSHYRRVTDDMGECEAVREYKICFAWNLYTKAKFGALKSVEHENGCLL